MTIEFEEYRAWIEQADIASGERDELKAGDIPSTYQELRDRFRQVFPAEADTTENRSVDRSHILLENFRSFKARRAFEDVREEYAIADSHWERVCTVVEKNPYKITIIETLFRNKVPHEIICNAAELPGRALESAEWPLRDLVSNNPSVVTWEETELFLVKIYQACLPQDEFLLKLKELLCRDWFFIQNIIHNGLNHEKVLAADALLTEEEKESALVIGFEKLIARNTLKKLCKDQDEQKETEDTAVVEEPVAMPDVKLTEVQKEWLLSFSRDNSRYLSYCCNILADNWQFFSADMELEYFMDISKINAKLGPGMYYSWYPDNYFEALGGRKAHRGGGGWVFPERFRSPEARKRLQGAFYSVLGLESDDSIPFLFGGTFGSGFDMYRENFYALSRLDEEYQERYKLKVMGLEEALLKYKIVELTVRKQNVDINENFPLFEEIVDCVSSNAHLVPFLHHIWDICKNKPERLNVAVGVIPTLEPYDAEFHVRYIDTIIDQGQEAADTYLAATIEKARGLHDPQTVPSLRDEPEYRWMIRYNYEECIQRDPALKLCGGSIWDICKDNPERLNAAVKVIPTVKPWEPEFHTRLIDVFTQQGKEAGDAYLAATIEKAKGLHDPQTAPLLQNDLDYKWMRFYHFQDLTKPELKPYVDRIWNICKDNPERLNAAVEVVPTVEPYETEFHTRLIDVFTQQGKEAGDAYLAATIEKAKGLNNPATAVALRDDPDYQWMIRHIYLDGNYSSYEKNLTCGDHPEHLEGYTFDREGYTIRLSGLAGYKVKEGREEDTQLLRSYQKRLLAVKNFIESREPSNEALQAALQQKADILFKEHVHPKFKELEKDDKKLNLREKLICLYISEVIRKIEASGKAQQNLESSAVALSPEVEAAVAALNKEIKSLLEELKDCSPERTTEINGRLKDLRAQKNMMEGRDIDDGYKPNTEILDLMVIYHYAFNEHLEPYISRSADVIKAEKDQVARNYLLWQELSNIYGENIKHALTHDFSTENEEDLPQVDGITATYKAIIQAASEAGTIPQEQIKEKQRSGIVSNLIENDRIPDNKKYGILCKKINQMVIGPLKISKEERAELKAAVEEALKPFATTPTVEVFEKLMPRIYAIRAPYRVKFETKMNELFTADIGAINLEIDKYEEIKEVEMKETTMGGARNKEVIKLQKARNIRARYMKTQETANARMGAYLCFAGDTKMYENPDYFELVLFNEDSGKCVGITGHLSIEANDGKKYLLFLPNPNQSFVEQVSALKTFEFQFDKVCEFAEQNGFDGIVVDSSERDIHGRTTNRGGMYPNLIRQERLRDEKGKVRLVQFGRRVELSNPYGYEDGALIWEKKAV